MELLSALKADVKSSLAECVPELQGLNSFITNGQSFGPEVSSHLLMLSMSAFSMQKPV